MGRAVQIAAVAGAVMAIAAMSTSSRQALRNCTSLLVGTLGVVAFAVYGGAGKARGGGRFSSGSARGTMTTPTPRVVLAHAGTTLGTQTFKPTTAPRHVHEPLVSAVTYFLTRPRPIRGTAYELNGGMDMDRNHAASLMSVATNRSMTFAEAEEQCNALRLRASVTAPCSYHQTVASAAMHMLPLHADDIAECLHVLWQNAASQQSDA